MTVGVNATASVTLPVHVYVFAPAPFNVVEFPKQITEFEATALTVGVTLAVVVYPLTTTLVTAQLLTEPVKSKLVKVPVFAVPETFVKLVTALLSLFAIP